MSFAELLINSNVREQRGVFVRTFFIRLIAGAIADTTTQRKLCLLSIDA